MTLDAPARKHRKKVSARTRSRSSRDAAAASSFANAWCRDAREASD